MKGMECFGKRALKVGLLLSAILLCPATGMALDNDFWATGLNFHFFPPGARALGMGGAFVGLADDATAAASNPAGLAQLNRTQLAIEGRYFTTDSQEKSFANPLGGSVRSRSNEDDVTEISFGAFSSPVYDLFNIAVFYNRPISFDVEKDVLFSRRSQNIPSTMEISLDEVGVSLGKSFADGRLMLGFGLGAQFFDLKARELSTTRVDNGFRRDFAGVMDENDVGLGFRVGILGKPIDSLRLGFSYTRMDSFDTQIRYQLFPGSAVWHTKFDVPDNFAFGAAYNILPNWVVVFEGKYVMYSQLMNGFVVDTTYGDQSIASPESEFDIDDVMELHFGTEYVINAIPNVPIALRAGFFYEPAHDLEYKGPSQLQRELFDGGDDRYHFTFGVGTVLFNHLQIDVGADITDESQNVGLSMVYQF